MTYVLPINRPPKCRYCVGIDPDKNESGLAVWDYQQKKFIRHEALYFWALQQACFEYGQSETVFFVEAGWLNEGQNEYQATTLPKDFATWNRLRREAYKFKRGTDVGINFGAGWAITHVLRANGYTVNHYCPQTPKWDHELQVKITGVRAHVNQDVRDAIRAVWMNK